MFSYVFNNNIFLKERTKSKSFFMDYGTTSELAIIFFLQPEKFVIP